MHERSLIHSGRGETATQLAQESAATRASETPATRAGETTATTTKTPPNAASKTALASATETPTERAHETTTSPGTTSLPSTGHPETPAEHAREGRVLGIDLESTPMIALAIVTGLGLAILSASPLGALRAVVLALALGALAWAVLDVREIVHQANESRTDLAVVAGAVTALHTIAAVLAVWLVAAHGQQLTGRQPFNPGAS